MNYQLFRPHALLMPYVKYYANIEFEAGYCEEKILGGVPNNSSYIVFNYSGTLAKAIIDGRVFQSAGHLSTQLTAPMYLSTEESFKIFLVALYPTAVYELFNIKASELLNQSCNIISVLGTSGSNIVERVLSASSSRLRIHEIENFLLTRLKRVRSNTNSVKYAISLLANQFGNLSMKQLSRSINISERTLRIKFEETVGFSPKTYARIERFNQALSLINQNINIQDIVYQLGYYDQSHLIHELVNFSGNSPGTFFAKRNLITEGIDAVLI